MADVIKAAVVAAAIVFTGGLATVGLGASLTTLTFASGMLTATGMAVFTFVTTLVGGLVNGMGSKGGSAGAGNYGSKFAARGSIEARKIVYGQCRIGGTYVHMSTSGTDNNLFHAVIALTGHPITSLEKIKINDTTLTTSTTTINSETVYKVTNSKFLNSDNDNAFDNSGTLIRYIFEDGTQTTANQFLVNQVSSFGQNHIGKDCAFVYIQMVFDAEAFGSGVPQISFEVKGKKVYDPRNPSAAPAFSSNPALCIRDYISDTVYGLKAPDSEINDLTSAGGFAAAANVCDQTVNLNPSGTETRYTANGFTNFSADGRNVLDVLLSSCAGRITYTNGKFNMFAGASQTPSMTITDDHLLDQVQVVTNPQSGNLPNSVKPIHIDATNNFNSVDGIVFEDSTLVANDTPSGESSANYKKQMEVQLPFTTSGTMAQRIAKISLLSQRQSTTLSLFTSLKFFQLQPNDWVYVTNERLNFNQKVFEVISSNIEVNTSGQVVTIGNRLQLKEVAASVFNYATSDYQDPVDEGGGDDGGDYSVSTPTGLSLQQLSFVEGASFKADIGASWTNIQSDKIIGTEVAYKLSTETNYTGDIFVGKGVSAARIPNVVIGKTYNVKVRHLDMNGVASDYSSAVNISISDPSSIAAPTNFSASSNRVGILLSWTNPSNSNLRAIKIYRKTVDSTPTNDNDLVHTMNGEPSATSRFYQGQMDGLVAGTTYFFWVRAITHNGTHSAFSSSVSGSYSVYDKADINLSNVEDKSSATIRGEIVESDLVGSGNAFSVKPNKTTFADGSTEGVFNFSLDDGTATGVNVFSSAERTKLDRLRLGQDPSDASKSIQNDDISISKVSGAVRLTGGSGSSSDVSFDKADVGLNNLTNDTQVKSDLSNLSLTSDDFEVSGGSLAAKNALKNNQITIAKDTDGNISLSNAGSGSITVDKDDVGLDQVINAAQVKLDLSNAPNGIKNDQLSISKVSGAVRLSGGSASSSDVSFDKSDVGLSAVSNDAQVKLDLSNAPDAIKNSEIEDADIIGSGKVFAAGQKPNKTTFADNSTEGVFTLGVDGTDTTVNVFSSAERTKLDRLRAGQNPANASESILNSAIVAADIEGSGKAFPANSVSKLGGIEANATFGAQLGSSGSGNILDENDNNLTDAIVITSQGTSNDTNNVNSVAKADVTGAITAAQTTAANTIQNLAAGTQNINAASLNTGQINTSLLKIDELFLPTEGTAASGQACNFGSTMTQVSLGSIGDGAGFYMGTVSIEIVDPQNDDIRGASIHIDLKSGSTVVYTKYFPIGIKEGNQYYDAGDQFGDSNDLDVMHLEFAYFHTSNTALNLFINADSNDTLTTTLVKARAVRFGAETVTFNPTSISAVTNATASSTQDSGTVTVSGFTGSKQVNLSGNSTALVSINGGTFVNAASAGTITSGQTFEIRLTASATAGSTRAASVEIGGTSITFSVTTAGTYTPTYSGGGGSGGGGGGFETNNQIV